MLTPYCERGGVVLYHGDSLRVLHELADAGVQVDGVVTDPPYSSGGLHRSDRAASPVDKYIQTGAKSAEYLPTFAGDNRDQRSYERWLSQIMAASFRASRASAPCCVFTDWRQVAATVDAVQVGGWTYQGLLPWLKPKGAVRPRKGWFWGAGEFVVTGTAGAFDQPDEIGFLDGHIEAKAPPSATRVHVTEKPAAVCDWLISVVRPGGLVLDPFAGSGVVGMAALRSGRRCILIEAERTYCDVIANRLWGSP